MSPEETDAGINALAMDVVKLARHLAPGYGIDDVATAMACGFAMTKILFAVSPNADTALRAIEIANGAAVKAMADMIAGANTPNQATQ